MSGTYCSRHWAPMAAEYRLQNSDSFVVGPAPLHHLRQFSREDPKNPESPCCVRPGRHLQQDLRQRRYSRTVPNRRRGDAVWLCPGMRHNLQSRSAGGPNGPAPLQAGFSCGDRRRFGLRHLRTWSHEQLEARDNSRLRTPQSPAPGEPDKSGTSQVLQ
jgi:hypothetical protein